MTFSATTRIPVVWCKRDYKMLLFACIIL